MRWSAAAESNAGGCGKRPTMNIIGIDLGKTVFHLIAMDPEGAVLTKKRLSRPQLIAFMRNTPPSVVAGLTILGGCSSAKAMRPS